MRRRDRGRPRSTNVDPTAAADATDAGWRRQRLVAAGVTVLVLALVAPRALGAPPPGPSTSGAPPLARAVAVTYDMPADWNDFRDTVVAYQAEQNVRKRRIEIHWITALSSTGDTALNALRALNTELGAFHDESVRARNWIRDGAPFPALSGDANACVDAVQRYLEARIATTRNFFPIGRLVLRYREAETAGTLSAEKAQRIRAAIQAALPTWRTANAERMARMAAVRACMSRPVAAGVPDGPAGASPRVPPTAPPPTQPPPTDPAPAQPPPDTGAANLRTYANPRVWIEYDGAMVSAPILATGCDGTKVRCDQLALAGILDAFCGMPASATAPPAGSVQHKVGEPETIGSSQGFDVSTAPAPSGVVARKPNNALGVWRAQPLTSNTGSYIIAEIVCER